MRSDRIVLAQGGRTPDESVPWLVSADRALPLRRCDDLVPAGRADSVASLVAEWSRHEADLHALTTSAETVELVATMGVDVDSLRHDAPLRPRQVFCTIGNFRGQVAQAAADADDGPEGPRADARRRAALDGLRQRRETGEPYVSLTSPARVAAPFGLLPITHDTLDWEVEIAAVLKSDTYQVDPARAGESVAGYCIANDVTIRDRVFRADVAGLGSDWVQSKGAPGTLPLGPWFVPAWQVADVADLRLRLWVGDQLMQDDLASDMVFPIEEQVGYLADHVQLFAGDVICTGSPAGFGAHHGRYLRPGDVVTAEVTGLGRQVVTCVGAPADGGARRSLETACAVGA